MNWYTFTHKTTNLSEFSADCRYWYHRVLDCWYDVTTGLRNIWHWLPVIWADHGSSSGFIYRVLAHKLRLQAAAIEKYGYYIDKDRDIRELRQAAVYLERAVERDYLVDENPWQRKFYQEFGRPSLRSANEEGDLFVYVGGQGVKDEKRRRFLIKKAMEYEKTMSRQDLELFARLFARKSRRWFH